MSDDPIQPAPAGLGPKSYWLTRFLILRWLGLVYCIAFLSLAHQVTALIGRDGLLPAQSFLARLAAHFGSRGDAFLARPTLFFLGAPDGALVAAAWIGAALSFVVLLGCANAAMMLALWALYMSFVHVGQDWYGYGWEIQLLETGFLAVFLCPLWDARPFPRRPPPVVVIWLFRWLAFRIMLGAGLIKLRGDPCWRDLSCLDFHYETQPIPNPLSRTLHFMPRWVQRAGVLFNHVVELVAPWFAFGPRRLRLASGALMLAFQVVLIVSGNLSFLNWLTIVPILACLDDAFLRRLLPAWIVVQAERAARAEPRASRLQWAASLALAGVVAALSVDPVRNLLSERQAMNTSFNRLALVNTYGAFGSVGRQRPEIVFEGTADPVVTPATVWKPYEFKCKPGDPLRRPCVVTPYHYRLDWQIWFAAMSNPRRYPWTVHFVSKLLQSDAATLGLLAGNPFPEAPPRFVRAELYRYAFAPADDPSGAWWRRERVGPWLPPLSRDDPRLRQFLAAHGWTP